jgi:hypothetical protein
MYAPYNNCTVQIRELFAASVNIASVAVLWFLNDFFPDPDPTFQLVSDPDPYPTWIFLILT